MVTVLELTPAADGRRIYILLKKTKYAKNANMCDTLTPAAEFIYIYTMKFTPLTGVNCQTTFETHIHTKSRKTSYRAQNPV